MVVTLRQRYGYGARSQSRLGTTEGWAVVLSDPPYVSRTQWWADEVMHQGEKETYYVEAQDQLEAFSKAMKLQEEKNGYLDNRL